MKQDELDLWLKEVVPKHCEPEKEKASLADLEALRDRIDAWGKRGLAASKTTDDLDPRRLDAEDRLNEMREWRGYLVLAIRAMRGQPYDRKKLAGWLAGQAFKQGDMREVLRIVDSAGIQAPKDTSLKVG